MTREPLIDPRKSHREHHAPGIPEIRQFDQLCRSQVLLVGCFVNHTPIQAFYLNFAAKKVRFRSPLKVIEFKL